MNSIETALTVLAVVSGLGFLLFHYPQIKKLSAEKPIAIVLFLLALVGLAVWGSFVDTLVPVVGAAVLVALLFVSLHRKRRKMIATGLMTVALIGALLNLQTSYASSGGVEIRTQKVAVKGEALYDGELVLLDTGDEVALIEQAKELVLTELAEQGLEGEVVEVRVEHQDAEAGQVWFQPAGFLPIVVVVVVVIIIGWVVIKIIKACKKLPPRRLPPEECPPGLPPLEFAPAIVPTFTNFYAACTAYVPEYEVCTETWETNGLYYGTFELSGEVKRSGSNLTMAVSGSVHYPSSQSVTYGQFVKGMQPWGLTLSTNEPPPVGVSTYAKNGVPATTDGLPFTVEGNTVIMRDLQGSSATLRSVVEFSKDLITWTPLVTIDLPEGQKVRIQDDSGPERAFYRFRLVAP